MKSCGKFYGYFDTKKAHYLKYIILIFLGYLDQNGISQKVSVLTQRYDNKRSGWNSNEKILNSLNVGPATFGLIFTRSVDDQIYAQPLVVSDLMINGKVQDVVFVATVNNSIYAFNATDPSASSPLWYVNLTPPGARAVRNTDMTGACGGHYTVFSGKLSTVGTPVIDRSTSTMYVVTSDLISSDSIYEHRLHALDITTGIEKSGSPVVVNVSFQGNGSGTKNGIIPFYSQRQNQRAGLLLYNGVVYVCWGSHCDWNPYHGWIVGFDASTLQVKYVYNDTPEGVGGGIWMSGAGPVVDDNGNLIVATGNGTTGTKNNPNDPVNRGESVLKLAPNNNSFQILDFFTPFNYAYLDSNDLDLGVSGVLLIPGTNLCVSGTKEGKLYVLNTTNLGKCTPGNNGVVQTLNLDPSSILNHIHGMPVYFHYYGPVDIQNIYVWSESDYLTQFCFDRNTGRFDLSKTIKGTLKLDNGMPGGQLSISSNGQTFSTGIVWANHPLSGNANESLQPGSLDAYNAQDVTQLLWRSTMVPSRDSIGTYSKFNTPVVANGRVYMGTFSKRLNVYGLLSVSPTQQTSGVSTSSLADTSVKLFFNTGNGGRRIVWIAKGYSGSPAIMNYTSYTGASQFGTGSTDGYGWYCADNGTHLHDSVTITGLLPSTPYKIIVYEYNGENGYEVYLTNESSMNTVYFVTKGTQNISFSPIPEKKYGDSDFDPGAVSNSGLAVSYSSNKTSVATIVNNKVHIIGAGSSVITASQSGNGYYMPADSVSKAFTVRKATLKVVASDTFKFQGAENPLLRLSFSGFVDGDNLTSLDTMPTAYTSATTLSQVGNYSIVVSGGYDNNYDFQFVNGVLSVLPLTDIHMASQDSSIHVFPDPVTEYVVIKTENPNTKVNVRLIDVNGNEQLINFIDQEKLDVGFLKPGVYILIVNHTRFKIVKI